MMVFNFLAVLLVTIVINTKNVFTSASCRYFPSYPVLKPSQYTICPDVCCTLRTPTNTTNACCKAADTSKDYAIFSVVRIVINFLIVVFVIVCVLTIGFTIIFCCKRKSRGKRISRNGIIQLNGLQLQANTSNSNNDVNSQISIPDSLPSYNTVTNPQLLNPNGSEQLPTFNSVSKY